MFLAEINHGNRVLVNLGANVYLDYTVEELPRLLEHQLSKAEGTLKLLEEQMMVVNQQILTIKGNMIKVHLWKGRQEKMKLMQKKKKKHFNLNEYAAAAIDPCRIT